MTSNKAYYLGRNSIDDNGSVISGIEVPAEFAGSFHQGQRDMRAELNLSNDPEWDGE